MSCYRKCVFGWLLLNIEWSMRSCGLEISTSLCIALKNPCLCLGNPRNRGFKKHRRCTTSLSCSRRLCVSFVVFCGVVWEELWIKESVALKWTTTTTQDGRCGMCHANDINTTFNQLYVSGRPEAVLHKFGFE